MIFFDHGWIFCPFVRSRVFSSPPGKISAAELDILSDYKRCEVPKKDMLQLLCDAISEPSSLTTSKMGIAFSFCAVCGRGCVRAWPRASAHACTHAHTHARRNQHTHACSYAYPHASQHARSHVCTNVRTCARTHPPACAHTHACM